MDVGFKLQYKMMIIELSKLAQEISPLNFSMKIALNCSK